MAKRKLDEEDTLQKVECSQSKRSKTDEAAAKSTFASFDLDPRLLQAIAREKLSAPTPVQRRGIQLALDGKDVLVRAKTGSGKTLAYLLPILHFVLKRKATAGKAMKQTAALVLVPTKELATQVTVVLETLTAFCAQDVRYDNVSRKEDAAVTKARLAGVPDVVVATPGRASQWLNDGALKLDSLKYLVVDEADLVLNYGYEDDLSTISAAMPAGVQKIMMSATLRTETDTLTQLFFPTSSEQPTILDLSAEEAAEKPTLIQYVVRTAEEDKFLLIYTIFKLNLIKGKVIVFVADIDRGYRVKLFLEQFGVRSCVLNSELPVNSRLHVVEEFSKGVYDIIIAADEHDVVGEEGEQSKRPTPGDGTVTVEETRTETSAGEQENGAGGGMDGRTAEREDNRGSTTEPPTPLKKPRRRRADREFGISRGIDFRHVSCVLNFDLPTTSKSYTHRVGRTARAGQTGMALSFIVPKELYRKHKPTSIEQCKYDEQVLEKIMQRQQERGADVQEWNFDMQKLEGFRYRLSDALRAVTRIAVREARTHEIRQSLINSEKLKRHFEENPDDLRHLRHDTETHAVRQQQHLKHVPAYLLPSGGKAAVTKDVGFVSMRKDQESGLRKRREFSKGRGKGRLARVKGLDPLKSLNLRGRGKK